MKISASLEDYLRTIYELSQTNSKIRVTDIAASLNVQKSSVNNAINTLKEQRLVVYEKYKSVILTDSGIIRAKNIVKRHVLFKKFLTEILKVSDDISEEEAKDLSHCISCYTAAKLEEYIENIFSQKE